MSPDAQNGKDTERLHKGWKAIGLARLPIDKDLWVFTCVKHTAIRLIARRRTTEPIAPLATKARN